jgi:hypothetical protein
MARRKTPPDLVLAKYTLAERLRFLRAELYGERGGPALARRLGVPIRTWYNYEAGVTVPAEVILRIIELTAVEPMWLLHGKGPKFRSTAAGRPGDVASQDRSVGALLRTALQLLEQSEEGSDLDAPPHPENGPTAGLSRSELASQRYAPGGAHVLEGQGPPPVSGDLGSRNEWLDAQREGRCIQISGNAMAPIVADGAYVAFARAEERPTELDGKMVVTWVDGQPTVRWFQLCGNFALLRAENPATEPPQFLVPLDGSVPGLKFRRVLWINTPH